MANDSDSDDYLSEKFLVDVAAPSKPQTYVERRRAAQRESEIKQERNRKRSRRELEEESRKEGLSTSLFTRASEDGGNKAMAMMLKMGFKPGQSLGAVGGEDDDNASKDDVAEPLPAPHTKHRVEPLPVNMWQGRKGVGLGKRPAVPDGTERAAKVARIAADDENRTDYRGRAREGWEDRRAEGRMAAAQRTCKSLDEKAGKEFNVFWLDPHDLASFPPGLLDALAMEGAPGADGLLEDEQDDIGIPTAALAMRLRREMRQYQLRAITPEDSGDGEGDEQPSKKEATRSLTVTPELIQQAKDFLASPTQDRLKTLLGYLREQYSYCFWCGAEYEDSDDLQRHCPGPDEEDHD
ncbi:hypothetical protein AURDEDRAFT_180277 [Auricularia subglabra TFB-10046 SS5]|nr:hypothetical protein AURDEDRAFT_180277 [Auricularia subglabra TFB-10046 SS5]